jgi:hypothetical protein
MEDPMASASAWVRCTALTMEDPAEFAAKPNGPGRPKPEPEEAPPIAIADP